MESEMKSRHAAKAAATTTYHPTILSAARHVFSCWFSSLVGIGTDEGWRQEKYHVHWLRLYLGQALGDPARPGDTTHHRHTLLIFFFHVCHPAQHVGGRTVERLCYPHCLIWTCFGQLVFSFSLHPFDIGNGQAAGKRNVRAKQVGHCRKRRVDWGRSFGGCVCVTTTTGILFFSFCC
ncbi:hypothetical protein IWZ01DRAFT_250593 [Phyllosticta capitalensis]